MIVFPGARREVFEVQAGGFAPSPLSSVMSGPIHAVRGVAGRGESRIAGLKERRPAISLTGMTL